MKIVAQKMRNLSPSLFSSIIIKKLKQTEYKTLLRISSPKINWHYYLSTQVFCQQSFAKRKHSKSPIGVR